MTDTILVLLSILPAKQAPHLFAFAQSRNYVCPRLVPFRLIDDEAILACAAFVDLNPIRAGIAQTIEDSQFTSARLRLQTIVDFHSSVDPSSAPVPMQATTEFKAAIDSFLAPVEIDELNDPLGARASTSKYRCSDKGFLAMPTAA